MAHHDTTLMREHADLLRHIHEGMTVYDSEGDKLGTVDAVYFGAASDAAHMDSGATVPATAPEHPDANDDTFMESLAEVFDPRDQIPEEVAERLRYHGYIRIDGGWFGSDRYVMPEQIASVSDEGVYLSTQREHLVKE